MTDRPKPEQDDKGRFVSGNIGGGRGKGSRNKLGEAFLDDLLDHWEANGPAAIQACLDESPVQYVKVVASILPKELNVRVGELDELSDDEIDRRLRSLTTQLARAGFAFGDGEGQTGEAQQALGVPTVQ